MTTSSERGRTLFVGYQPATKPHSIEWVELRLAEWRYWATSGPSVFPVAAGRTIEARMRDEAGVTGSGDRKALPHPEAEQVERCIHRLPPELRRPLEAHYLEGGSFDEKALRCGTSRASYFQLVRSAKYCLWGMLAAERQGCGLDR